MFTAPKNDKNAEINKKSLMNFQRVQKKKAQSMGRFWAVGLGDI